MFLLARAISSIRVVFQRAASTACRTSRTGVMNVSHTMASTKPRVTGAFADIYQRTVAGKTHLEINTAQYLSEYRGSVFP